MIITIKHVDVETVGSGQKTYQKAEVLYDQGEYKNKTHKLMSFVNPSVFKTISNATKGDAFEVDVGKNDKGYNVWNSVRSSDGSSYASEPSALASPAARANAAPTAARTYETADERAVRQRLIVRQSSLTAALGVLSPGAKAPIDPEAVKKLAEDFTQWVFEEESLFDQPNDLQE